MWHVFRELAICLDEESEKNEKIPLMLLLYFSNGVKVAVDLLSISCHGIFLFFLKPQITEPRKYLRNSVIPLKVVKITAVGRGMEIFILTRMKRFFMLFIFKV